MNYEVPPKPKDPKHQLVDCTGDPAIIEAATLETVEFHGPIGGWWEGRFLVTADSLRQYREWMAKDAAPPENPKRQAYQLEHFWPDGSGWHSCEFMDDTTQEEAEAMMQEYQGLNRGEKFRLVVVKPTPDADKAGELLGHQSVQMTKSVYDRSVRVVRPLK